MRLSLLKIGIMAFLVGFPYLEPAAAETHTPTAYAGIMDLTSNEDMGIQHLRGEWMFTSEDGSAPIPIQVPGTWNHITGNPYSEGVYTLRLLPPTSAAEKAAIGGLLLPELSQALEVRVNGRLIFSSGDMKTGKADFTRELIPFMIEPEILLSIKIKNAQFRNGGLLYVPVFSDYDQLKRFRERKIFLEALIIGILLLVALYHLLLFAWRYQNVSALYLGFAALLMIFRGLTTGENLITVLFPNFSWTLDYRIEYISAYLSALALLRFLDTTFPFRNQFVKGAITIISGCIIAVSLFTTVLPISLLSKTVYLLQGCILICLLLGLAVIIHGYKEKKAASDLFFWGGLISIVLFIGDCAYYLFLPFSIFNSGLIGILIFLLVQTFVLSRIYGTAYLRAESLTRTLEDEVLKRTAALENTNHSLQEEITQRKRVEERLTVLSTTDPLTGAANRNKMNALLEQNHKVFLRYETCYGLIMFDVDHFKRVNDRYGHAVGDRVLKRLVEITLGVIRQCDILARWGGEEFLVLLPTLDIEGTVSAAERIRSALEEETHPEVGTVTASFGATIPQNRETMKDILARLDGYLYKAKQEGRNRVVHR